MANLNHGGEINTDSVLTPLPSLKHDTSSAPRMLTPSEIDWLQQNKAAAADKMVALLANMKQQAA